MQPVATLISTETAKQLTDEYIKAFCVRRAAEALELGPSYYRLWQSIETLILAGGKRLRPYMVLATYQAYNPTGLLSDVLPAAAAQELIHSAMLIHDDIIDRDTIRYGVKNVSGQYDEFYSNYVADKNERSHLSLSAALLAGDALISDAYRMIRKTIRPNELVDQAEEIFNTAIFEVIGGELLDTEVAFLPKGSISVDSISQYKTASYSFVGPLTTGAVLAQAPEHDINTLKEFSLILGIGYQLRDDLLGTFGNETVTGKSTVTDIQEGKRTYLIEQFERLATQEQKDIFFAIFHRYDASSEELLTAKKLLEDSGARAAVEQSIQEKYSDALTRISQLSLPTESKKTYEALVERCLNREM
jgi:geranylgeranyl diphosphate synthase type II